MFAVLGPVSKDNGVPAFAGAEGDAIDSTRTGTGACMALEGSGGGGQTGEGIRVRRTD